MSRADADGPVVDQPRVERRQEVARPAVVGGHDRDAEQGGLREGEPEPLGAMHGQQAVEQPDERVLLRGRQVAVDHVHVRVRAGGVEHGAVRGGIGVRAQRLDHERRAVPGAERAGERLDRAERVLALGHAAVVEGETGEPRVLRQAELLAADRRDDGLGHRRRHVDDGHRRDGRDRVGDEARARPHLVEPVEPARPVRGERRDLPPPQAHDVAPLERRGAELVAHAGHPVRVHADERHRVGRGVRPGGRRGAPARDRQLGDRRARRQQRAANLPRGLADAQRRAQVPSEVHADSAHGAA